MCEIANEYRKMKILSMFYFLDRDGDGFITMSDFVENMNLMSKIGNLSDLDRDACSKEHLSWWFLFNDFAEKNGGKVTPSFFVHRCLEYFSRKESIPESARYYQIMFNAIDKNKDGTISLDEFMVYYKAFNINDENHIKAIFRRLDVDSDGSISREEFLYAGYCYWFVADPENGYEFLHQIPGKPTSLSA